MLRRAPEKGVCVRVRVRARSVCEREREGEECRARARAAPAAAAGKGAKGGPARASSAKVVEDSGGCVVVEYGRPGESVAIRNRKLGGWAQKRKKHGSGGEWKRRNKV